MDTRRTDVIFIVCWVEYCRTVLLAATQLRFLTEGGESGCPAQGIAGQRPNPAGCGLRA